MKAFDREFTELQEQFEKNLKTYPGFYVNAKVERVKPNSDGKVIGGEFYTNGEISKLFTAYMLGYSFKEYLDR
jgi:hypothetical protein